MSNFIRKCGKITDILPIAWFLTFLLILLGQVFGLIPKALIHSDVPWIDISARYFIFIGIWVVGIAALFLKDNRPILETLKPGQNNSWKWILIGAGVGFGANALCALLSILLKDIGISFECFEPPRKNSCAGAICFRSSPDAIKTSGSPSSETDCCS